MKSAEELNALKEKIETMNKKLAEMTEEELKQVSGGIVPNLTICTPLRTFFWMGQPVGEFPVSSRLTPR